MQLNARAVQLCENLIRDADELRVSVDQNDVGTRVVDCGVKAAAGLEAGCRLAEICMGGLGHVSLVYESSPLVPGPSVTVRTDHPVAACMAAQYAGWQISGENYFAMGSGPFRAAAGREELFDQIGMRESPELAVGVLESSQLPPREMCVDVAAACGVSPDRLILLVARTASQAGNLQVVARSVETALHKMHELGFDIGTVGQGMGTCPLPPVAADDMSAIGRTNDAVLYGAQVTLWLRGRDEDIKSFGPRIPSCASTDYGEPFAAVFERYGRDFYQIDPHLFSPARVTLVNLNSGNVFSYGQVRADILGLTSSE
jgi:methenyltetrahydromethanopterin cyclohydrolase